MKKTASPAMIIREKEPQNLETPVSQVDSYLTPNDLFYIRNHFPEPKINLSTYRLLLDGAVKNPLSLTYDEIRAMPAETRMATLECAGNSRVFMTPRVEGAQWELGAVGNAEWTGVLLSSLLERAGLHDNACEIVLEGADQGKAKEGATPPCAITYARSIPREKAMEPDALIAYQMNGRDLTPAHGFPVRAIVPGHYGMASTKWLTHIRVITEPFHGYFQSSDYAYWDRLDGQPVKKPIREMHLKSEIFRPSSGEILEAGQTYLISGAAWTGETEVTDIEVSTDSGASWTPGQFLDPAVKYAWRRWQLEWQVPHRAGKYILLARARDAKGGAQPERHDPNYGTYVIDYPLPIEISVIAPTQG